MKRIRKPLPLRMAIVVLAAALAACGGGDGTVPLSPPPPAGGGGSGGPDVPVPDTTPPIATNDIADGALDKSRSLVIVFSESMDTASLQLGGSLGAEASAAWSRTNADNDTLTLSPTGGAWSGGSARALKVDAKDLAGNALATLDATFQVNMLFTTFQRADAVLGQSDFAGNQPNRGALAAADTMYYPSAAAVSSQGTLFVADSLNHRVLGYTPLAFANGASASFVLGQPDLQTSAAGTAADRLNGPTHVAIGAGRLLVADRQNNRVLIYDSAPADGTALPRVVLGQPDFTSRAAGCSPAGLRLPTAAAVTDDGKLAVADTVNNRILIWNSVPATNGQAPDLVLGQPDFAQCGTGRTTAQSLFLPQSVWTDGRRLAVTDANRNRVLIWNTFPTANHQPADIVLGQRSFTTGNVNDGGISDKSLYLPWEVASNGTQFAVADLKNHRILMWNTFPTTNFQAADVVLGQDDFTSIVANDDNQDAVQDAAPSARVLNSPQGLLFYRDKLLVSDRGNHRVLVFRAP